MKKKNNQVSELPSECTTIIVGREMTADGSMIVARSEDWDAIENTNKLIRQYIPKKDSFEHYTDKRIMSIQKKLNERPREKLNFSTPKREFFKHDL